MSFPVYNTQAYFDRLTALIDAGYPGTPDFAKVKFYKNNVTPDANMTPETFEEADFDGYTAPNCVMSAPSLNDQGMVIAKSTLINLTSSPGTDPQTVYGLYITNAAGDFIIAAQRFETPQQMGGEFAQSISGVWRVSEPLSSFGWISIED